MFRNPPEPPQHRLFSLSLSPGHAIFKLTYLSNHDYKHLYFESDAATINEIVLKVSVLSPGAGCAGPASTRFPGLAAATPPGTAQGSGARVAEEEPPAEHPPGSHAAGQLLCAHQQSRTPAASSQPPGNPDSLRMYLSFFYAPFLSFHPLSGAP